MSKTCGDIDGKPCEWCDPTVIGYAVCRSHSGLAAFRPDQKQACAPVLALAEARDRIAELEKESDMRLNDYRCAMVDLDSARRTLSEMQHERDDNAEQWALWRQRAEEAEAGRNRLMEAIRGYQSLLDMELSHQEISERREQIAEKFGLNRKARKDGGGE